jgi:hypothetical protein
VQISNASQEESIYASCSLLLLAAGGLNCGTKGLRRTKSL